MSQQQAPADFGRVDPDGTVYVRVGDTERSVGQIPDSTPEEALAFYTRRYENLAAEVTLLVSRVETQTMSPEEARKAIGTARTNVTEANAVGDRPGWMLSRNCSRPRSRRARPPARSRTRTP